MKIILDTDGTLTDFNQFILENAIPYFEKNYGFKVVYPNKLEIEDILDIKNRLINDRGYSDDQAQKEMKRMLDKFWISLRFVKFSLFSKFRSGVSKIINDFIKNGYEVQIHTSRSKTTENNIVGEIARAFTIWQYRMNGIYLSKDKYHFYASDEEKIKGIIKEKPQIAFDDKPEIIESLNRYNIKTICVDGNHNKDVVDSKQVAKINVFDSQDLAIKMDKLLDKKLIFYKREANSDDFYQKIRLSIPLILKIFDPIVLNSENLVRTNEEAVIYAPNHRSTLDPLIINAYIDEYIHWVALKRFFSGEDSIFNNSKNKLLCKITAECFGKLGYFPIERISDNPNANNFESLRDMINFLKIKSNLGIFPEGTTRRPEGSEFGTFDSSFLTLASKTEAIVQPITILWIKELNLKHKLIINFGESFKVENKKTKEAYDKFLQIQENSLLENKKIRDNISEDMKLTKKFPNI